MQALQCKAGQWPVMVVWSVRRQAGRSLFVANPPWRLLAAADVNADGTDDILWRNRGTGENWLYLMQQAQVMQNPPLIPSQPAVMPLVRYDFSAGDSLVARDGWQFWSDSWPVGSVADTQAKGLIFDYEASLPGQISGFVSVPENQGVYVRYAQKGAYNEVWGSADSPKPVRNLTRNTSLISAGRSTHDTGSKLLAVWNDDYSYSGTGSTIVLGMISECVFNADKSSQLTAAYRGAGKIDHGNRTNFSNIAGGTLITEQHRGQYLDLLLRARFSSVPGAKDGILQTWVRDQGQTDYQLRHNISDADLDKGISNKSWQAGYLMGWSNAGYDQPSRFHISKLEYWLQAPPELNSAAER